MLSEWLRASRILPVITPGDVAATVQLGRTLAAAGMRAADLVAAGDLESIAALAAEAMQAEPGHRSGANLDH